MSSTTQQIYKKAAFTIIELLTVMSIIVILFGMLVPAFNQVRRHAKNVRQNGQFHAIDSALDMFSNDFEGYPDSSDSDSTPHYCGAMKLAEALVGYDLLGFNPDSPFNGDITAVYEQASGPYPPAATPDNPDPDIINNIRKRKGPYIDVKGVNPTSLENLYINPGSYYDPKCVVLTDEFPRVRGLDPALTSQRYGMPILYYRANTSNAKHNPNPSSDAELAENIYNYEDNEHLINLGVAQNEGTKPPLDSITDPNGVAVFYDKTKDKNITAVSRPHNPETYILISAGFDGLYGTDDDIFNFEK
jgi:type II secretory pathway pseudopilin PulG